MLTSNNFARGMNQDIHPKYQPDGSYRMALNALLESKEGDLLSITNELGNLQTVTGYPEEKKIIGHRLLDDGTTVLFLFDPDPSRPEHEIGIYNPKTDMYTTYVYGACLNFSEDHYINAIYRLKNGCERIVYFTDNYNSYRVINLDRPEYYTQPPLKALTSCDLLKYSRDYRLPSFTAEVNNSNGNTDVGTYLFAYRLLDIDKNPTNWLTITNPVSISDNNEVLKDDPLTVYQYDGGVSNTGETGFVPTTTKSITLHITNVDTRFEFVQLAVIKYTASSGAISGVDVLTPEAIPDSALAVTNMDYIYTGYDSQIEDQTSLDELLSSKVFLDKVVTHEQKDGRLFVANLVTENKDYTGFQRHASSIKAEYVETFVDIDDPNSKDPEYYFGDGSLLHDEIYPYGIVYIWTDGTLSPVFHIPGRPMIDNTADVYGTNVYITANKDEWDTYDVTGDVNIFNPDKTMRWQVYNTFTDYGDGDEGLMGYYETDTTYPDIEVCDDDHADGYWGRDWTGALIEPGDPIRHHRMPAFFRDNLDSTNYNRKLGVKFTMSEEYPHVDISGHFYVFGDRSFEKTVIDTGMIVPLGSDNFSYQTGSASVELAYKFSSYDYHLPSTEIDIGPTRLDYPIYGFVSANTLYNEKMLTANYLTINKLHSSPTIDDVSDVGGLPNYAYDEIIYSKPSSIVRHEPWDIPEEINFKIDQQYYLPKSVATTDGSSEEVSYVQLANSVFDTVQNLSISTNLGVLYLDREFPEVTDYTLTDTGWTLNTNDFFRDRNTFYVSLKADATVFRNLYAIEYIRFDSTNQNKQTGITHTATTYNGDIFLSPLDIVDIHWFTDPDNSDAKTARCEWSSALIENPINLGLRHGDSNEPYKYNYYKFKNTDTDSTFLLYVAQKYYEPVDGVFAFYPEEHLYNEAYTRTNSLQKYIPVSADYDFCTDCLQRFPYRIMYSQADDIERRKDAYLNILPNNYKDVDGNSGPITDMFINFNEMYINTPYSLYHVPTNPQILTTTDNTSVFLGSGGVLPQPFRPIKNIDTPGGGSSSWKARVSTDFGTFYVDDVAGRAFLLGNQLSDLSLAGMRSFWRDNGTVQFLAQFEKLTGSVYPNQALPSDLGVGFTSTYDPMHKRIIVHKRDFLIRPDYEDNFVYTPGSSPIIGKGDIWFDGTYWYHNRKDLTSEIISLTDPRFFINKSFTLSYSLITNSWASFHSYLPYYMFNDSNWFYSNNIYKHNIGNYQEYYGIKYDHIVDLIAKNNPVDTKMTTSVQYSSSTWEDLYTPLDITFDRMIAYNSKQSTGVRALEVLDDYYESNVTGNTLVRETDNKWKLNHIRNYATPGLPIWSTNWLDIQTNPFNWIDRAPVNVDPNKNLFQLDRLRDYYLGLRLFFKPTQNAKIVTDLINTVFVNRNR